MNKNNKNSKQENLDILLQKRLEDYPIRGENYDNLMVAIKELSSEIMRETTNGNYKIPELSSDTLLNFTKSPIFVCGGMKTGTTLLTQLLDGHKNLLVMPGDSNYHSKFFKEKMNFSELFAHWLQRMINPSGKKPFWFLGSNIEKYFEFASHLKHFHDDHEDFLAVVLSVFATINCGSKTNHWVEKTPGNEFAVNALSEKFPNSKFIHIHRDPLINLASLKKMCGFKGYPYDVKTFSARIEQQIDIGFENQRKLGRRRYFILKYEDLTSNPAETMKQISEFLEIEFENILLKPTENLIDATANSMYRESRVSGVIEHIDKNERWKEELSIEEKEIFINHLFKKVVNLGYSNWKEKDISQYRRLSLKIKAIFK